MTDSHVVVHMPRHVHSAQREAWLLAGKLHQQVPDGWTVIGGQMVQFHGWRRGTAPNRTTTDLDAGVAARANPQGFQTLSGVLQELGLKPVPHPSGIEHRWQKEAVGGGRVQVDLLLPSGLGDRVPPSINGRPGVQSRGVQWATEMSQPWQLEVDGQQLVVPVPSLLGAILAKASALRNSNDVDFGRHLSDISFLARVATPDDLVQPLTPRQVSRVLDAIDRIGSPDVTLKRLRMALERSLRR